MLTQKKVKHDDLLCFQTVLTHSRSRVVLQVLKEAMEANNNFTVYVTESMPNSAGFVFFKKSLLHIFIFAGPGFWWILVQIGCDSNQYNYLVKF